MTLHPLSHLPRQDPPAGPLRYIGLSSENNPMSRPIIVLFRVFQENTKLA